MYLMISTYLVPLDEVDRARDDHLAFLAGLEERGLMVSAGRRDPAVGGIVLLGVDTEAAARELMADDPYVVGGLAEYAAMGWNPARGVLADWRRPV
ncbi:YciI family protein [Actinoplanes sp. NPDC051346]|uniref:YciI family protein n=1 Tax=Actinoplanes sp. NPDC051346 TaxID=3155048 RepID=UPI00342AAF6C